MKELCSMKAVKEVGSFLLQYWQSPGLSERFGSIS